MSAISSNICVKCDGRGFKWEPGRLAKGETCPHCKGTGETSSKHYLAFAAIFIIIAIVVYNIGKVSS